MKYACIASEGDGKRCSALLDVKDLKNVDSCRCPAHQDPRYPRALQPHLILCLFTIPRDAGMSLVRFGVRMIERERTPLDPATGTLVFGPVGARRVTLARFVDELLDNEEYHLTGLHLRESFNSRDNIVLVSSFEKEKCDIMLPKGVELDLFMKFFGYRYRWGYVHVHINGADQHGRICHSINCGARTQEEGRDFAFERGLYAIR